MLSNKKYTEIDNKLFWEIKDDIYWTLEAHFGKGKARDIIIASFDQAIRYYGDTKELYEYFNRIIKDLEAQDA